MPPIPAGRISTGSPRMKCQSHGFALLARTRTSTSVSPTVGVSTSTSFSTSWGAPYSCWTIAFIIPPSRIRGSLLSPRAIGGWPSTASKSRRRYRLGATGRRFRVAAVPRSDPLLPNTPRRSAGLYRASADTSARVLLVAILVPPDLGARRTHGSHVDVPIEVSVQVFLRQQGAAFEAGHQVAGQLDHDLNLDLGSDDTARLAARPARRAPFGSSGSPRTSGGFRLPPNVRWRNLLRQGGRRLNRRWDGPRKRIPLRDPSAGSTLSAAAGARSRP